MASQIIRLPEKLTIEELFQFSRLLNSFKAIDLLEVDLGTNKWFPPYAMLYVSLSIRQFKNRNLGCRVVLRNFKYHEYPAHMGFFHMCGAEYGREVGEAFGSARYLPITRVGKEQLYGGAADRFIEIQDLIQRHADSIAFMVSRDDSRKSPMFEVLSYSIRELFRNVFEHSEMNELFYCAQYWPSKNKVEVSIADSGIGIRKSLYANPNFRFNNDKDAIEWALLPSVSGKTHQPRRSDVWFNSGYGLYMINRLARNGGNFVISSGERAIYFSKRTKTNYFASLQGTSIRINLDINSIGALRERLDEFREDGQKIASQISGSGNRPPSAMSLLLRRDYH